jgi:uncharacterized protein HemX
MTKNIEYLVGLREEIDRLEQLLENKTDELTELQAEYDKLEEKYNANSWVLDEIQDRLRKRED